MALSTNLTKREKELVYLICEAYEGGASDDMDIYLYVKMYMDISYKEVSEFTNEHLGPFNMTIGAPNNYKLH
jgi:hypothetical protein